MPDASLEWQGDFSLTPSGDLALADADVLTRQRIERRLFTAMRGYLFDLGYGAGLPQKIGGLLRPYEVESIVRSQIAQEASVAKIPPCKITVSGTVAGLRTIRIDYTDALNGRQISLDLAV